MARDKNCKWYFDPQTGAEEGPSDALVQSFKKTPYPSLIRESIQNSIDAVYDSEEPVRVNIELKKLEVSQFPGFFGLRNHIKGCVKHYPDNPKAIEKFEPMCKTLEANSYSAYIGYIQVSDFNTKGMPYKAGDTNCPFYAFVRSRGVSAKENQTSGGSFGFGKAAYFNMSPIRTVIVSTMLPNGKHVFEGVSSLCTHEYKGEIKTSVGFYDNNNGQPVTDESMIPVPFKRKEAGTSISIMGIDLKKSDYIIKEMIESVLRSFWMAIYEGTLVVRIESYCIDKESICNYMEEFFPKELDTTKWSNYYNPRPYFDAVRYANEGTNRFRFFKERIMDLGEVELYLNINKDATDKIAYMRQTLMFIYAKKTGTNYGVNGVFICRGERGNRMLRNIENPAHDEWKAENWRDDNNRTHQSAKSIMETLQSFIAKSLEALFKSENTGSLNITGLEEYLYVPESLIADDPEDNITHTLQENNAGVPTGDLQDDGSSVKTQITQPVNDTIANQGSQIGHVVITKNGQIKTRENGSRTVGIGNIHDGKNRKPKNPAAGNKFKQADVEENAEGSFLEYIPVSFRVIAEIESSKVYHNIVFYSPRATNNGEIELVVGGEQADEIPEIAEVVTQPSGIRDNFIVGLKVNEGKNVVKVRFNDNMKHAVILKAYERK